MQAHTKKHPTETIELRFIGPIVNMAQAIENLKPLGFVDTSDSVPWREAYPELKDEDLPGVCLRGSRYKEGISQRQLSEMTGIPKSLHASLSAESRIEEISLNTYIVALLSERNAYSKMQKIIKTR